jgi:hypothetical protein
VEIPSVVTVTFDVLVTAAAGEWVTNTAMLDVDGMMTYADQSFEVSAPVQFAWNGMVDDDWDNPANWTPEGVPDTLEETAIIPGGVMTYPMVMMDTTIGDLLIANGGEVTIPEGVELTVEGMVENNGKLVIVKDVPEVTRTFFNLYDSSMGIVYPGVEIQPYAGMRAPMGPTMVEISGNQDWTTVAGEVVQRRIDITPGFTNTGATLRIYYLDGELSGQVPADMNLWHYDGEPAHWSLAGTVSETGTIPGGYYVEGAGVSDWSPFALRSGLVAPTEVSFASLAARGGAVALLLVVGFVAAAWVVARKRK